MSITHITSLSQLNTILTKSKDKLSVIDFHATWCGPCHAIAPIYESLAKQYTNVNFLKCDVDAASEVSQKYAVSAMPTFVFLKGSTKVDQVRGADKTGLANTIKKHASGTPSGSGAFYGKGQTLGGAPAQPDIVGEVQQTLNKASEGITQIDPQVKILLGLVGLYLVFWYLG